MRKKRLTKFEPGSGNKIKHQPSIPAGYRRCVIIGSTDTGKTCLIPEIIKRLYPPDNIIIFCKGNLDQDPYQWIRDNYEGGDTGVVERDTLEGIEDYFAENAETLKGCRHNVVIIDDFLDKSELQKTEFLATRGRHYHCSIYWLCQDLFHLPKVIRDNTNEMILFPCGNSYRMTLQWCGALCESKDLTRYYKEICSEPYSWLYICKDPYLQSAMRVRKKFNGILK